MLSSTSTSTTDHRLVVVHDAHVDRPDRQRSGPRDDAAGVTQLDAASTSSPAAIPCRICRGPLPTAWGPDPRSAAPRHAGCWGATTSASPRSATSSAGPRGSRSISGSRATPTQLRLVRAAPPSCSRLPQRGREAADEVIVVSSTTPRSRASPLAPASAPRGGLVGVAAYFYAGVPPRRSQAIQIPVLCDGSGGVRRVRRRSRPTASPSTSSPTTRGERRALSRAPHHLRRRSHDRLPSRYERCPGTRDVIGPGTGDGIDPWWARPPLRAVLSRSGAWSCGRPRPATSPARRRPAPRSGAGRSPRSRSRRGGPARRAGRAG